MLCVEILKSGLFYCVKFLKRILFNRFTENAKKWIFLSRKNLIIIAIPNYCQILATPATPLNYAEFGAPAKY